MSTYEAVQVAGVILGIFGLIAAGGLLALETAAWIWYRRDGGKLGLIAWLKGI